MDVLQNIRYQDKPALLFFENYIVDLLGHLPAEKNQYLEDMRLQDIFNTQAVEWRDVVRETLQLSDTIDICILDRWLQLQEQDDPRSADEFCKQFADEYFDESSDLDVWDRESLLEAITRVQAYYQGDDIEMIAPEILVDEIFRQVAESLLAEDSDEAITGELIEATRPDGKSESERTSEAAS